MEGGDEWKRTGGMQSNSSANQGNPPRRFAPTSTTSGPRRRQIKFTVSPISIPSPHNLLDWPSFIVSCSSSNQIYPSVGRRNRLGIELLTTGLLEVFGRCNASFVYDRGLNPRRVLTKPSKPAHNSGFDNEKHDYILYVNDILGNEEGRK